VKVEVEGRELTLSNLDKPLFPDGFTKGAILDYYVRIAPTMLPHLKDRPVTVKRFPNGTDTSGFIEKNVPRHAPEWLRTVTLPRKAGLRSGGDERDTTQFTVVDDLATLSWLANLASVEFHTPMWRVDRQGRPKAPDMIVFDLDPGAPATITQCCEIAMMLRERTARDGIELLAKTSGSKGLQCYGLITKKRWQPGRSSEYAHQVAEELEQEAPELAVSRMTKSLRPGKVLIDWSQNNPAKTTVTVYSLRALDHPSVSSPVTWEEVEQGAEAKNDLLAYTPAQVIERVEEKGDIFAALAG
jgi:bifunctional non-homologous end joining protein LigD